MEGTGQETVEKFKITERERYLLDLVARIITTGYLHYHYLYLELRASDHSEVDESDLLAQEEAFEQLRSHIQNLTKIIPS